MRFHLTLLILVFTTGNLMAEDITSRDFAAGYYLQVDAKGAVYSLELPDDVYLTVQSAELSDVRVFNGAGEVVPHEFGLVKTDHTALREKGDIPFFPLFQAAPSSETDEFSLQVTRNVAGAILHINSDLATDTPEEKITGYILDLSGLKVEAAELELYWEKENDSSVFTVHLEQSSDLVRWTPLVHRATLADLQFGGQRVEQRIVDLPKKPLKYLKLTWQKSRSPLKLTKILWVSRVIEARRKHRWTSLSSKTIRDADDQLVVEFATNYRLPISVGQIRFPETNSIARLSIESRPDTDGGWRRRCEQVFYNMNFDGATIQNEPCTFSPTADPLWQVVVQQDGAGLESAKSAITLELGWQPSEMFFVTRGTPPYLLAFGSSKIAQLDKNPRDDMLLQTIQATSSRQEIKPARLGERIILGGDAALQGRAKPMPWKKWLLWAVLVAGVGLLAFMARSLLKEIRTEEEKRVSED